jgi:histidine triad (HIT) family protein
VNANSADCVFCKVLRGELPSTVVFEDEQTLAFLDISPAADGHTLVIPKNHTEDLLTVSPADLAAVACATQTVARILDDRLSSDGFSVFQSNRAAGWQDVFHLHFHVVPRWEGDSLRLPWRSAPASQERSAEVAARLRITTP